MVYLCEDFVFPLLHMSTATQDFTALTASALTPEQAQELRQMLIPETIEKYPDIIQMLFQTPSLVFDEKKYWLQLLPLMSPDHVERLRTILMTERQKLAEINAGYQQGVDTLQKLANKPSQEEIQRKKEEIRAQEALAARSEDDHEDKLIDLLNNV